MYLWPADVRERLERSCPGKKMIGDSLICHVVVKCLLQVFSWSRVDLKGLVSKKLVWALELVVSQ